MKSLNDIRSGFATGKIEVTAHALHRMVERNISKQEIVDAGASAIEIEDYPTDKYYPSCLLMGFTTDRRPLHLHISRVESAGVRLITIYEPNERDWNEGFTKRR